MSRHVLNIYIKVSPVYFPKNSVRADYIKEKQQKIFYKLKS